MTQRETREYIWAQLPMAEGYAEIAAGMAIDPVLAFMGLKIKDGYIFMQSNNKS